MPIFKQSIVIQAVVILLATAALWGAALVVPQPMPSPQGSDVLYGVLYGWFAGTPKLAAIIGLLLVVAGGIMLNILLVDLNLTAQNSLLPTLLYIICMSASAMTLTPMTVVSLLMVWCMWQLAIKGTLLTIPPERACATTALIGVSSMFYLPATLLIISYMLVSINYRLYSWRDWVILLLGFAAPYVILVTVLLFTGGLAGWWQGVADAFSNIHLTVSQTPVLSIIGGLILVVALIAGLVSILQRSGESMVQWQKNAITMLCIIPGAVAMLVFSRLYPIDMQFFALPFTFGVALLLTTTQHSSSFDRKKRRDWVYTLILILLFVAAMIC